MNIEVVAEPNELTIKITGILKKQDGMELGECILREVKNYKPKQLVLDCTNLAAVSFDSVPPIVSAIERSRIGKYNVRSVRCNSVVERTLRGSDFERVGRIE